MRHFRELSRGMCCLLQLFSVTDTERLGNNLSGQYKRGIGMALQIGIGNFSGTFASNMYRAQDAPRYVLGSTL